MTTVFSPVWVSSVRHLETFSLIVSQASWVQKMLGIYDIPKGYPHLRLCWGIHRIPLVMFANGVLRIEDSRVRFESQPHPKRFRWMGNVARNLEPDFIFHLAPNDVIGVEPYENPRPFMKYYSLAWTRLRTAVAGVMSDVLVAVGGYGLTMGGIRRQNKNLFAALQTAFPARRTGRDGAL